jgi:hypothetical protein
VLQGVCSAGQGGGGYSAASLASYPVRLHGVLQVFTVLDLLRGLAQQRPTSPRTAAHPAAGVAASSDNKGGGKAAVSPLTAGSPSSPDALALPRSASKAPLSPLLARSSLRSVPAEWVQHVLQLLEVRHVAHECLL